MVGVDGSSPVAPKAGADALVISWCGC